MIALRSWTPLAAAALALGLVACGDDETTDDHHHTLEAFSLGFSPMVGDRTVGCTDQMTGLGPDGQHRIAISDLRFYVSNLKFYDADGESLEVELDANEFQYNSPDGQVALIDLTGNSEGSCAGNAIALAEGTARTNSKISGKTVVEHATKVTFDVGLPQPLMKKIIAANTAENAPSPMNEMYWSWASGYRHLVVNLVVETSTGTRGEGYLHVGSRDCGPADGKALEDRDQCTFVNTPKVELTGFDLSTDQVKLDLGALVGGLDFVTAIRDPETHAVIGQGPGLECHSSPSQPDCAVLLSNLGIDPTTGASTAASDRVFKVK